MKIKQAIVFSKLLSLVFCLNVMGTDNFPPAGAAYDDMPPTKKVTKTKAMPITEDDDVSNHTNGGAQENQEIEELLIAADSDSVSGVASEEGVESKSK